MAHSETLFTPGPRASERYDPGDRARTGGVMAVAPAASAAVGRRLERGRHRRGPFGHRAHGAEVSTRLDPFFVAGCHEAAHVCAHLDFGYPIERCRIWQTQGEVIGEVDGQRGLVYRPRHEACIALAGPCAEARLTGEPLLDVLSTVSRRDFETTLNALVRSSRPCSFNMMLPAIDDWLDQSWARIYRLGHALRAWRELSYHEVLAVLA
jgi:hypothetical protein